jgi:hypothetical protein
MSGERHPLITRLKDYRIGRDIVQSLHNHHTKLAQGVYHVFATTIIIPRHIRKIVAIECEASSARDFVIALGARHLRSQYE